MRKYKIEMASRWLQFVAQNMKEASKKGLLSAAERTVSHIQTEIIPNVDRVPVDQGIYRAAWRATETEEGALVSNDSPIASIIEDGVDPEHVVIGRKMIDALAEWIRRKGIGGTEVVRAGMTKRLKPSKTEAMRLAWAIANNMKKNGIFGGKGLKILGRAEESIPRFIEEEVTAELKKAFRE